MRPGEVAQHRENSSHDEGAVESPCSRLAGCEAACVDPAGRAELNAAGEPAGQAGLAKIRLDGRALAKLAELDPTGRTRLVERVLKTFLGSVVRLRPQLESHWRERDLVNLRLVAHTLKSSAAYVGAMRLSEVCAAIENAIRLDKPDALPALVETTGGAFDEAVDAIETLLKALS